MYNVGDKVKYKAYPIWTYTITHIDRTTDEFTLECPAVKCKLSAYDLLTYYIKVGSDEDQLDIFGTPYLPTGKDNDKKHCYHDWVKYVGLRETYEYCKLCDEKRPVNE